MEILTACNIVCESVYRSSEHYSKEAMDGKLIVYTTDCEAAISAIEDALTGT